MMYLKRVWILALIAGCLLAACGGGQLTMEDVAQVQERYESELMSQPGVVGIAIGLCGDRDEEEPCLKVLVDELTPELEERIPEELDGVRVEIEVTGTFQSQP